MTVFYIEKNSESNSLHDKIHASKELESVQKFHGEYSRAFRGREYVDQNFSRALLLFCYAKTRQQRLFRWNRQIMRNVLSSKSSCVYSIDGKFAQMENHSESTIFEERGLLLRAIRYIRVSRGRGNMKIAKAYIALFFCLAVKAIHLELVSDLTSEEFIAALRRFFA